MSFAAKRIRGLMGRLLSSLESILQCSLDDIDPKEEFALHGEDILLIRNVILDGCNDTIRSFPAKEVGHNDVNFPREVFPILKNAILSWELVDEDVTIPAIELRGEARFIYEIRDQIGRGIVYKMDNGYCYSCLGLHDIVNHVVPFLDRARLARIIIADGEYAAWRSEVVDRYLGGEE